MKTKLETLKEEFLKGNYKKAIFIVHLGEKRIKC